MCSSLVKPLGLWILWHFVFSSYHSSTVTWSSFDMPHLPITANMKRDVISFKSSVWCNLTPSPGELAEIRRPRGLCCLLTSNQWVLVRTKTIPVEHYNVYTYLHLFNGCFRCLPKKKKGDAICSKLGLARKEAFDGVDGRWRWSRSSYADAWDQIWSSRCLQRKSFMIWAKMIFA